MNRLILLTILIGVTSINVNVFASDSQEHDTQPVFDVVILNGLLIDGSGSEAVQRDIGIRGDVITAIGKLENVLAQRTIDASGLMISPGFIDLHSHAENDLLARPDAMNNIRQGVTTLLAGNCGGSPIDVDDYFKRISQQSTALNVGLLIGHNSVRSEVMQRENRHATDAEMEAMKALVERAMKQGAFGMSSGLLYIPGTFAPPEELISLAAVVNALDGFYASHMRSEGSKVIEALQEAIDVGEKTGIPVHISHHKTAGPSAWGLSQQTLAMIDTQRSKGLDVSLDVYPYTASNTNLGVLMPSWSLAGGQQAFVERMQDPTARERIHKEVKDILLNQRSGMEFSRIFISQYASDPSLEALTFEQVLQARGAELTLDNAASLAMELQLNGGGRGIYHTMTDDDLERIMSHPMASIASDGAGVPWMQGSPHPRNYGTYPRIIARYVRDKQLFSLPEAVKKMTSIPAERMRLKDRGLIKESYKADILIWDPELIQDLSSFSEPHQYSTGIDYVMVNGTLVIDKGEATGARPGLALRANAQ